MHLLYQKLSERWPILAVGLILAGLWATLMIQSSTAQPARNQEKPLSYGLTLPNVMAPVIRRDVHKQASPEDEGFTGRSLRLPALWELFTINK